MGYEPLNESTVVDYIKNHSDMNGVFDEDAILTAEEVGDGNLNQIFIIRSVNNPAQAAIAKQALPYLRVAGDSWPLSRERMRFEAQALLSYNDLVPGLVPEVYHYDDEMSLVIMEYLGAHEVMRKPLVACKRFNNFVDHISTFLARTLFFTSDLYLTGIEKKEMQAKYINPHLCKITEDFVFSNPYMTSPENNWNPLIDADVQAVRCNSDLKLAITEMKEKFMTHGQALVHGDLHTGSVMLNEQDTRVIDPEFAFYGPMGFDIGAILANFILNYLSHYAHTEDSETRTGYQAYLLDTTRSVWTEFARKFDQLWIENNRGELTPQKYWEFPGGSDAFARFREIYIKNILQDTAGLGGCKMMRRMMGIVSVWDVTSIADMEKRASVERLAIKIGKRWVLEHNQINSIEDLLGIVLDETAGVAQ